MIGLIFPVRLLHSLLSAGFKRRTKRPTNPIPASLVSLVAGVFRSPNFIPIQVMVRSEQWWQRLPADQQQSGMTVRECCQVAGVHVSSFYRWQKRSSS